MNIIDPRRVSMKSGLRDRNNYWRKPWLLHATRCLNEVRS